MYVHFFGIGKLLLLESLQFWLNILTSWQKHVSGNFFKCLLCVGISYGMSMMYKFLSVANESWNLPVPSFLKTEVIHPWVPFGAGLNLASSPISISSLEISYASLGVEFIAFFCPFFRFEIFAVEKRRVVFQLLECLRIFHPFQQLLVCDKIHVFFLKDCIYKRKKGFFPIRKHDFVLVNEPRRVPH